MTTPPKRKLPPSETMGKALATLLETGTDGKDLLGEVIRRGAEHVLQKSLEGEVRTFLAGSAMNAANTALADTAIGTARAR